MAEPEEGNASLGYWCRQLGELGRGSRSQTAPSAGHAVKGGLGGKIGSQKKAVEVSFGWSGRPTKQIPSSSSDSIVL